MPKVFPLKLLDETILPVFLIFGAKIGGLLLANIVFNLNWEPSFTQFSLSTPFVRYLDPNSAQLARDVGTIAMFAAIAVGFGWVVFRAHELHLAYLHPSIIKKLFLAGKDKLLVDSFEIYHQAASWLALTWFVFIQSWLEVLSSNVSLAAFSFGASVVLTLNILLFLDLQREALGSGKKINY